MKKQLSYLYLTLRDFVVSLEESISSPEGMEYLFSKYGWEIAMDEDGYEKLNGVLVFKEPLEKFIAAAEELINKAPDEEIELSEMEPIIVQGKELVQLLADFEIDSVGELEGPLKDKAFWENIADHILDDLLVTYMRHYKPIAYGLLQFFGVIRYAQIDPEDEHRMVYTRTIWDWDQLVALVTGPLGAFEEYYHWDQQGVPFNHPLLLQNMQKVLESVRILSAVNVPSDDFLGNTKFNPSPVYNVEEEVMELSIPFAHGMDFSNLAIVELGLSVIPIPKNGADAPSGFLVRPIAQGATGGRDLKINDYFKFDWNLTADLSNLLQFTVFPDEIDLESGELDVGAGFGFHSTFTEPLYVLGKENTTRLEIRGIGIEAKIIGSLEDLETQLILRFDGSPGLNTVIVFEETDGFLKETVTNKPMEAGFSPEIVWSSKSGITFNGNISLDLAANLNKEVGGITFKTLYIAMGEGENDSISASVGLGLTGKLGPAQFTIEKIGFSLDALHYTRQQLQEQLFGDPSLIFGNLGLDINYLPPKGVGIQLESEIISGGGFLELDHENHRYAGVLSLKLSLEELDIDIVAIGLINTRLPNGEKGFSMLISISVLFEPAFQLPFGFTLNGVGGLVGIHRTTKVDILKERIRSGAIGSIMFPQNVIQNASKIISDLRAVFPVQKSHYVIAPFFKIGYYTPTILELDLGILLEFPFKGRMILLGSLAVYLPNKDVEKRLGEIHVDVFGDLNFAESYVLIEGRLRDSHLVKIPFSGGFAFMVDWGDDPQFLLSVGGYHPRYKKPDRFLQYPD